MAREPVGRIGTAFHISGSGRCVAATLAIELRLLVTGSYTNELYELRRPREGISQVGDARLPSIRSLQPPEP